MLSPETPPILSFESSWRSLYDVILESLLPINLDVGESPSMVILRLLRTWGVRSLPPPALSLCMQLTASRDISRQTPSWSYHWVVASLQVSREGTSAMTF